MTTSAPLDSDQAALVARRARQIRRAGYAFFGGISLWLSAALIAGVFSGLSSGQIEDPFTGQSHAYDAALCQQWATTLRAEMPAAQANPPRHLWNMMAESWLRRCGYLSDADSDALDAHLPASNSPR